VLALVPVRPIRELAFLMSVGLLIDAFVVRTLLVPSLIAIVGPVSAWPRRLRPPAVPAPVHAATAAAAPAVAAPVRAAPADAPAAAPSSARLLLRLVWLGIALTVLGRRR
jgi:RND superfamily putative drug exporter